MSNNVGKDYKLPRHLMSEAMKFALLPKDKQAEVLNSLSDKVIKALPYDWRWWARPNQIAPDGDWLFWLVLAGRGFGKTRSGAEWVLECINSGNYHRGALIGATSADVRDVMVTGESGILSISPPWNMPLYEPSKRKLTWPNGAICTMYSADEPNRLRGPQHDFGWCDELAAWQYLDRAWSNFLLGLRLGNDPKVCITTTPQPVQELIDIMEDPKTVVTGGSTYENRANLADVFDQIISKYEGTSLGDQEIHAQIIKLKGVLFNVDHIQREYEPDNLPPMERIVVAVDPATTSKERSDETGICVAGKGMDGKYYIREMKGIKESPAGWAKEVIKLYEKYFAGRIIAESNNGGEMVEHTIRTVSVDAPIKLISASKGKLKRAEPIAALYEKGKVVHVGRFAEGEKQMTIFRNLPNEKNDIVDAMVWALTELSGEEAQPFAPPRVGGYRRGLANFRML